MPYENITADWTLDKINRLGRFLEILTAERKNYELIVPKLDSIRDTRIAAFNIWRNVLTSTNFGLILMHQNVFRDEWWITNFSSNGQPIPKAAIDHTSHEYLMMLKISLFQGLNMALERTFRVLCKAMNLSKCASNSAQASVVYSTLLDHLELGRWKDVTNIVRLVRNSLHNNGIHAPPGNEGKQISIYYLRGQPIEFVPNSIIEFTSWEFAITLVEDLQSMFIAVLKHTSIVSIPLIIDPFAEQS